MDLNRLEKAVKEILYAIGENPEREGLLDTPKRVAKMYAEVFSCIETDPSKHLQTFFQEDKYDDVIIVKDIEFHSMCEHHLLPFYGKAHVAYIPRNDKITGLSKLARIVVDYAKRPNLQERLTKNILNALVDKLDVLGAIVVVEAEHTCMTMRGIKSRGAITVTESSSGILRTDKDKRKEILDLIKG